VFGYDDTACGAHAQYLTIRQDASLALIPADQTHVQAAPATEGSHYALANISKAKVRAGQRVLINGATGAIGSAAVQLLAGRGVRMAAVCDTPHVELVQRRAPNGSSTAPRKDFTTDDQTYDVMFDAVGKSSFGRCRRLLKPRGCTCPLTLARAARTRSWRSSPRYCPASRCWPATRGTSRG
jgi:NADPH:quinone reductase-like Zn-dependent oxidoreductase